MGIFKVCYEAAAWHIAWLFCKRVIGDVFTCGKCKNRMPPCSNYCSKCGAPLHTLDEIEASDEELQYYEGIIDRLSADNESEIVILMKAMKIVFQNLMIKENKHFDLFYPGSGIYIYYHPYEKYKIGKAVNVLNRLDDHRCSAPSLELLHVIETPDQAWCEDFLHNKYRHRRIHPIREYFDLTNDDLEWLFSVKVLKSPKSISDQLSLLDLL